MRIIEELNRFRPGIYDPLPSPSPPPHGAQFFYNHTKFPPPSLLLQLHAAEAEFKGKTHLGRGPHAKWYLQYPKSPASIKRSSRQLNWERMIRVFFFLP